MRFTPCQSRCQLVENTCQGCGRSIEEILSTGTLVQRILALLSQHDQQRALAMMDQLSREILIHFEQTDH